MNIEHQPPSSAAPANASEPQRQAPLVLAVDDEPELLNLLEFTLRSEGYRVNAARDGLEALDQVAAERPDLVIMDVTMPEMDGFEALRRIKENAATENLPIVMLTARAQEADILAGWLRGADLYLTKPFDPFELLAHVARVLRETGVTDDEYYKSLPKSGNRASST